MLLLHNIQHKQTMPKNTKLKQLTYIHDLADIPTRLNRIDPGHWAGGKKMVPADLSYSSSRWRKLRSLFLKQHPLCVFCLADDRTVPATVVDHCIPHQGDSDLFWDIENLQPLCQQCHSSSKQREERSAGYY
ncbi:HNH endonuclease family protein [Xanthomonas phage OP1]|uniref:HNH endonuclease family protein n=1 Tax=Xanthomonas phage OP1 TaxID=2994040 RepID=Q2NPD2_9CAUD|nr:HNH endonuclease [Xanthomonas phage OP1]BAE72764.1 HNH endonuclease family protein [Xanthomonas phage OP1]